ncbi:uncharacterized protein [Littorina saxatilis]|uniref:Uncharacterized protein n=1 Tax=Littorina saxatilis TaxID=31220 RepID=A0AAN9BT58_9CAEN
MEIDVASAATTTTPHNSTTSLAHPHSQSQGHTLRQDRKRKEPGSSSHTLKSILRQRSELTSSKSARSCAQKARQRRSVKFFIEDKREEVSRWSGQRLRYLALDLDMWDSLPYAAMRSVNKQKTRHTKHVKLDHGRSVEEKSSSLELDSQPSWKSICSGHTGTYSTDLLKSGTAPEIQEMEKSYFVSRWLQQNSKEASGSLAGCKGRSETMLALPALSDCVIASPSLPVAVTFGAPARVMPVAVSPASVSVFAQHGTSSSSSSGPHGVSLAPRLSLALDRRPLAGHRAGSFCVHSSHWLPFAVDALPVACGVDPDVTPSVMNLSTGFHSMSLKAFRRPD